MRFTRFFIFILSLFLIAFALVVFGWPLLGPLPIPRIVFRPFTVKVPILVYHSLRLIRPTDPDDLKFFSVEPDVFGRQLDYLISHDYSVITLDELVSCLKHKRQPPPRSVIIAFDDGWANQYQEGFPRLKARGLSAVFYIFSNAVGHGHYMARDDLKEMARAGMVIASHTRSHPFLDKITDPARLRGEIAGGKAALEKHLGQPVDHFAYPFGRTNGQILAEVKAAGFTTARGVRYGKEHTRADLFDLKIMFVKNDLSQFTGL